jgi:hypothetical protein
MSEWAQQILPCIKEVFCRTAFTNHKRLNMSETLHLITDNDRDILDGDRGMDRGSECDPIPKPHHSSDIFQHDSNLRGRVPHSR